MDKDNSNAQNNMMIYQNDSLLPNNNNDYNDNFPNQNIYGHK